MDETKSVPHRMSSLMPPGKFDFSDMNDWSKWMRHFERYRIVSSLDKQLQEYQVNTFMYTIYPTMVRIS